MSLTSRQHISANHTGPSSQRKPSASLSSGAFGRTKRRKQGSMISKSYMEQTPGRGSDKGAGAGGDPRLVVELDDHQNGRHVADGARAVPQPSGTVGLRVLVAAEGDLAGSHLNAHPVGGLDKPAARQGHNPLRLRVAVPIADPADR